MSGAAHVLSIDAIDRLRAGLGLFVDEAGQALDDVRMELDRFVDWLEHEQSAYWRHEILRCEQRVAEAKVDLHRARAATVSTEHTPSCLQEQKVLDAAKRRLAGAEEKLAAVRRWIPIIQHAVHEYHMHIAPLVNGLTYELPRALRRLEQLASHLSAYVSQTPPTASVDVSEPFASRELAADADAVSPGAAGSQDREEATHEHP